MSIVLENLTKRFGNLLVVDRVSLEVPDGELFVLLGASGSGKSTVLRLVASLIQPDGGRVLLHGRDVTYATPQERGVGFVFQNYSIFRHMSVADNIEFGLRIRKVSPAERARKRDELLELVGMAGLGARYSDQLSGGQRQRVALARALAYEPSVLLLDEPFGALDVKIRAQLRRSLKEIQQRLGVTTVLVTHDQDEAFELGDRIAVMERGHLLELGDSEALYNQPRSLFVATFLGAGNVLVGRARDGKAHLGPLSLPIPGDKPHDEGASVQLLFRPEQVALSEQATNGAGAVLGQGTVIEQHFSGATRRLRLRLPRLPQTRQVAPPVPFGEEGMLVDALVPAEQPLSGNELWVSLRGWHVLEQPRPHLLVYDTGVGDAAALQVAAPLADSLRANVTLLGVAASAEQAETLRPSLTTRKQQAGLSRADLRLRYGDPAEQIIAEQAETLYTVLLVGTEGRPNDTLMGLLDLPDTPLLVVKGAPAAFQNILICTAAGEPGKSDVRVGGWLARRLGARATLLYINRGEPHADTRAKGHLDRAAATLSSLEVRCEVRMRDAATPTEGILAQAQEGSHDLIVVGGHGPQSRSVLARDDVTVQVLSGAQCPVLVVPAENI